MRHTSPRPPSTRLASRLALLVSLAGPALAPVAGLAALGLSASEASAFVWPNVPELVERMLASNDVADRRSAAQRLLSLPPEVARPLATKAMADGDVEVRLRAAQAVIATTVPKAGDLVVNWLGEGDARLRRAACDVIRAAPTTASVLALGRVLSDPDPQVRLAAARAMGSAGLASAVSPLLGHLDDPTPEVRVEVVGALGRIGDARAVLPLIGKIQDQSADVRRTAARSLGELGDKRAAAALMLALRDNSSEVRIEAVTSLGKLRADDAVAVIVPLLSPDTNNPNVVSFGPRATPTGPSERDVQAAALRALGRIGSEAAVKALVAKLEGEDASTERSDVRDALVRVGKPAVAQLVLAVGGSSASKAPANAALTLGKLRAKEGVDAISKAMQRGSVPLKVGLRALGDVGSAAALPLVLELLTDPDAGVRKLAVRTAGELLDPADADGRAVDPAAEQLADPQTPLDEKIELVRLLGRTGSPRAEKPLLALAKTKNKALRNALVEAFGSLKKGSAAVDAALVEVLGASEPEARLAAALALSKVGTGAVAVPLLDKLVVSAEQDRGALGVALSGVLSRVDPAKSTDIVVKVRAALKTAPDVARDALVEGLGRLGTTEAVAALEDVAKGAADDRRKAAESLAGVAGGLGLLKKLSADSDPGVRASAAWALGASSTKGELTLLSALLRDPDHMVAANAAASLGRLSAREKLGADVSPLLCKATSDGRAHVRANALSALVVSALDCGGVVERELLGRDPSEGVRLAAVRAVEALASRKPTEARPGESKPAAADPKPGESKPAAADPKPGDKPSEGKPVESKPTETEAELAQRALRRCAAEERTATIAQACSRVLLDEKAAVSARLDDVVVFVAPEGRDEPVPRAPFALVRPDGLVRLGLADRRGALFERAVVAGTLRLASPAP